MSVAFTPDAPAASLFARTTGSASVFAAQYVAQGGRCFWCQALALPAALTWEHVTPRHVTKLRRRQGRLGCVLAHERCNKARGGLVIGSPRFDKWLRRVMRGDIRRYERKDNQRWMQNAKLSDHEP